MHGIGVVSFLSLLSSLSSSSQPPHSFSCVGGGGGVGMFVVEANQLISGVCGSSSWAASVIACPVSLAISSSSV